MDSGDEVPKIHVVEVPHIHGQDVLGRFYKKLDEEFGLYSQVRILSEDLKAKTDKEMRDIFRYSEFEHDNAPLIYPSLERKSENEIAIRIWQNWRSQNTDIANFSLTQADGRNGSVKLIEESTQETSDHDSVGAAISEMWETALDMLPEKLKIRVSELLTSAEEEAPAPEPDW